MIKNRPINDTVYLIYFHIKIDDNFFLLADTNVIITTGDLLTKPMLNSQINEAVLTNTPVYDI